MAGKHLKETAFDQWNYIRMEMKEAIVESLESFEDQDDEGYTRWYGRRHDKGWLNTFRFYYFKSIIFTALAYLGWVKKPAGTKEGALLDYVHQGWSKNRLKNNDYKNGYKAGKAEAWENWYLYSRNGFELA
jgi:hypothetical protein